uniref:Cysteine-rich repeat secretory protein 60 n=1 Tax=Cajanus cajan TaxID=3821 RepID=A0A151U9K1_CAJCA|nr:Cysteine-rich repeat secretory protein 60 [Cajanus cajan]
MAKKAAAVISISLTAFFVISVLSSSVDFFLYGGCTQQRYAPTSPYESNLNSLLTSLVNSATYASYNNFTVVGSSPADVAYGLYQDAVLGGLSGSGGYFRVGGSGEVRGVAQCCGDLSFGECQDCVGEAIRRLRSDCAVADYGDVFLAKCYARFSTNGAHAYNKAHPGKSDNGGEKTFAIIVGLLAGVAILIIFLAFLRRICEGQGKLNSLYLTFISDVSFLFN